ncbi:MAG: PIN domain-containing protein [Bacteroidales bacterium]|jgi:predicted nucleic acid-binding protein|nr:PIN domain-containing protein [Bacteroidales bacterium]
MRDRVFFDTNILIYAYFRTNDEKQEISQQLLHENFAVISTQVLQELCNAMHKKAKVDYSIIKLIVEECIKNCSKLFINESNTVFKACDIAAQYGFSFYDSMIIAAALECECTILYSEDLQHKQLIDRKLTILNLFL